MKTTIASILVASATAAIAEVFPLEWNMTYRTDVPYEVELLPARIGGAKSFEVRADGRALGVVQFAGKEAGSVCLRFTVPPGTKRLECEAGAQVTARPAADSEKVDNLFAGALDAANASRWTFTNGTVVKIEPKDGAMEFRCSRGSPFVSYEVPVPESARGKFAKIELDVTSLTPMTWGSKIRFAQLDADGNMLPQSVSDPRWTSHMRPRGVKAAYRETGRIDSRAAKLRLDIEMRSVGRNVDEYGLPSSDPANTEPHLVVSRVAVRTAASLPFPKYDDANFGEGVSGGEGDTSLAVGGGRAFWYQCHPQAVWAEGEAVRTEDELFFPNAAGTAEAWFKPSGWESPTARYTLFEAYNGYHAAEHSREKANSMFLLEYHPATKMFLFSANDHYGHSWNGGAHAELRAGEWSHVAMQWKPGENAGIFVNGRRVLTVELKGYVVTDMSDMGRRWINDYQPMEFYIGARWNTARSAIGLRTDAPFFGGQIDELRVSTGLRYSDGGFTPAKRFAVDAATRAHFGFDRSFDGMSGGGTEFIRGTFRAPVDRVDHTLTFADGRKLQYRPAKILPEADPLVQLDIVNYQDMPTVEEFESAREVKRGAFRMKSGDTVKVECAGKPYTDYVEIRNVSGSTIRYPVLFNEGDLDPRSFGDLRDTLLRAKMNDRDRVNRIFNFVIKASDYFMDRQISFKPGEDRPGIAMGDAMLMLNSYCGFECGPLNNMTANMFACSGGCLASQTGGYGHSFEQVFYDGKNHIYDLSAQSFFAAMDNESAAYLEEAGDQPGVIFRTGRSPDHFIRFGHRGYAAQTPDYSEKVGVTLNPGETFRVWFGNDGWQNLLRRVPPASAKGPKVSKRENHEWKTIYTKECDAKMEKGEEVWRVLRKFPEFASGYLEHDSRPSASNPAFSDVTEDSFAYRVKSGYQIVRGEYEAELEKGGVAPLEISTDFGKTWRPLRSPAVYQVMARLDYLVRVKAPIAAVKRFRARTQVEINSRIFPGRLRKGANALNFKAAGGGEAQVTVQWREKAKRAVVSGGAYSGAIPGWERQLFVMNPAKGLSLKVEGFSDGAAVECPDGLAGCVKDGMLTLKAVRPMKDGFAYVTVKDGAAERLLTVYVSPVARLVLADGAKLVGGASLKAAGGDRVQPCAWMERKGDGATFSFDPLPAGKYMIYGLSRFPSRTKGATGPSARLLGFTPPGESAPVAACGPISIPMTYYKAEYGAEGGRANFKWDTLADPRQTYHVSWLMARFDCPSFDHVDWTLMAPRPDGVELAAMLIVPAGDEEAYLDLLSNLAGLNYEGSRVK